MALQRTVTLLPGVENHRAGRVLGDDGEARIVRTFHARFGSIKCGGTTTARQAAEYVLREGKHAGDEDGIEDDAGDVEASAGDKEAMLADARRIRQTARITRGPTGERILATQIIELPAESTKEQRQACAQAFVDDWKERGHQAIAVVHMHGHDKDRPQPHLHVLATGRPVAADGTVDRSAPLWRNRDEVKAERARTARLVNEHCHTVAAFHPGGFKDIGREEDTPKWRTPTGVYLKVMAAEAEGAGWEEKEEAGRAQYAAARKSAELAEPKRTRKEEIKAARRRGEKPPRVRPTQRQRIALAEAGRRELAADLDRLAADRARQATEKQQAETRAAKAEADRVVSAKAVVYWCGRVGEVRGAVAERARQAAQALDEQRKRADNAEAALPGAVERATTAEGRVRELEELNKTQTKYVTDWHGERDAELPDLATVEGQREAWANMRAWETEARKKAGAEAAAKAEIEAALKDERGFTQAAIAEAVQRALEDEQARTQERIDAAVRLALEDERGRAIETGEEDRDGRGTGRADGKDRGALVAGGGNDDGDRDGAEIGGGDPDGGGQHTGAVPADGDPRHSGAPEEAAVEPGVVADSPAAEVVDAARRSGGGAAGALGGAAEPDGDHPAATALSRLAGLADAAHRRVAGRTAAPGPQADLVEGVEPPGDPLAAARAHVFTPHPYTGRTADHGVDDPLADDQATLRGQHKDAVRWKNYTAKDAVDQGDAKFREDGRHATVLWAQRMVDIEAHALKRGIKLKPRSRDSDAERGRGDEGR